MRFHDLRHTFATMAISNGVNVETLSSMLCRHSAYFVLDTYRGESCDVNGIHYLNVEAYLKGLA